MYNCWRKKILAYRFFSSVKKQGVIGAVQLIDCIARIEQYAIDADCFETTFNTISAIPEGRGKIAAKYIGKRMIR